MLLEKGLKQPSHCSAQAAAETKHSSSFKPDVQMPFDLPIALLMCA